VVILSDKGAVVPAILTPGKAEKLFRRLLVPNRIASDSSALSARPL